jgi:GNAT superfamily N-acetyltransferase
VAFAITFSADAAGTLHDIGSFLAQRPAEHNLVLTILHQRAASGEPGRYWTVRDGERPVGLILQSPLVFRATLTPMVPEAVRTAVECIAADDVTLPGVEGEAATAAAFAGHWTEVCRTGARPSLGTRLLLLGDLTVPEGVPGALRYAEEDDTALVHRWYSDFAAELGEQGPTKERIAERIAESEIFLWDDDGRIACMVGCSGAVAGTVRIGPVFTALDMRRRGYAGACVGFVSQMAVEAGHNCVLYTDLGNPTSNSVYRSLGYRTISENVRYEFGLERDT